MILAGVPLVKGRCLMWWKRGRELCRSLSAALKMAGLGGSFCVCRGVEGGTARSEDWRGAGVGPSLDLGRRWTR